MRKIIKVIQTHIIKNRDEGAGLHPIQIIFDDGRIMSCDGCEILGESEVVYSTRPFSVYVETTAPIVLKDGRRFN
jgi:hypothetical protein